MRVRTLLLSTLFICFVISGCSGQLQLETNPQFQSLCETDDSCICTPGSSDECYGGPDGTAGIGTCVAGTQTCDSEGLSYGACTGAVEPVAEVCGDGLDNDCDGNSDEDCACAPGSSSSCYGGPDGTAGVGVCALGTHVCDSEGLGYGACTGSVEPVTEVCGDGLDNDCDGSSDDGCVCVPSSSGSCYNGPDGTAGIGTCVAGTQACDSEGLSYGACTGSVEPVAEVCGDGLDNDCDGSSDDGCVCVPSSSASCYGGPDGTVNVGTCTAGTQTCNSDGLGYGTCTGAVEPVTEVCGDGLDNDCDGSSDDGCVCVPDSIDSCYEGPDGTVNVGTCTAGTQTCNPDGLGYGACTGAVEPVTEVCGDGLDNDCDGVDDNGCCVPATEVCGDGIDNDCDGTIDEGCIGNFAWNDANINGLQDSGEPGLAGVTFTLFTSGNVLVQSVVSDSNGAYYFTAVPAGSYYVTVDLASLPPRVGGWGITNMNVGSDDTIDSDFDGEDLRTPVFIFNGDAINHIDGGVFEGTAA